MGILETLYRWSSIIFVGWVIGFPTYKKFMNESFLDDLSVYLFNIGLIGAVTSAIVFTDIIV